MMQGLLHLQKGKINAMIEMLEEMFALKYGRGCDIDFEDLEHIDNKKRIKKFIVDAQLQ